MQILTGKEQEYNDYKNKIKERGNDKIIIYLEKWANLLEEKIKDTRSYPDIIIQKYADSFSHKAGEPIDDKFIKECAITILGWYWIYGDNLKNWYNRI